MTRKRLAPPEWERLPDDELLRLRIRDLGLSIEGTPLADRIGRLYGELDAAGIPFHPRCYLADEWLCPDRVPVIGIPFYLAHPRLTQLERRMMLEAEGGDDAWCMRLLRHEAGHALNYAYRLYARTRWRELFGPFSAPYSDTYYFEPYSRQYVVHLQDHYAQAHPDEDFAETFAVWLDPAGDWRTRYRSWPALAKLEYVDRLAARIGGQEPPVTDGPTPWAADRMTSTLQAYYARRHRTASDDFPGFYDPGLQRLFGTGKSQLAAARFLRRHRRAVIAAAAHWTGSRRYDADRLLRKLVQRAAALELYVHGPEQAVLADTTAFVTAVLARLPVIPKEGHGR